MARLVFLGTPEYAVPSLEACLAEHEVLAVITQPDRLGGRGRRQLMAPPVKAVALEHGVPVLQPQRLGRDAATLAFLQEAHCDLFVLAAYGQILRPQVLALARRGVLGVHASLLPRWRGAAPVAAAIAAGDCQTGVSIMLTEAGLDTGPVLATQVVAIAPDDTTGTLTARLARAGAQLLSTTLPRWLNEEIVPSPQDPTLATYAPEILKAQGRIDWTLPAAALERHIRAMSPWPGAYTNTPAGVRLAIQRARVAAAAAETTPGCVLSLDGQLAVTTGQGLLLLDQVQPAGRPLMSGSAFLRGQQQLIGTLLGAGDVA
ncbi:MAG: methionyl-tRNA formyltransferase [Anaerolineae bacterium]|nr:methionyl-tRNA formyltransferase [Chloroflexota bacterium]